MPITNYSVLKGRPIAGKVVSGSISPASSRVCGHLAKTIFIAGEHCQFTT